MRRSTIWLTEFLFCLSLFVFSVSPIGLRVCCAAAPQESADQEEVAQILDEQAALASRYKLLEEKLFSLYEYERDSNPLRSSLLKRAFIQSQEEMTAEQLETIAGLLGQGDLKEAETGQGQVLEELRALLKLLESEDRGKRVRDDIRRHQEYLKEVERILRIQRGIRAQTESGGDAGRLEQSQNQAADRTEQLAENIRESEETPARESDDVDPDESADDPNESSSDDSTEPAESEPGDNADNESESGDGAEPNSQPPDSQSEDSQPGAPENGQQSESQQGQQGGPQGQGQQGQGQQGQGQQGDGQSGDNPSGQSDQQPQNPVRERIENAEQRMRDAAKDLKRAEQEQSVEDMRAAEAEMAAAKKELEEILRQLREEEIERTLAKLEGRFRQMLEREIRLHEQTLKLDATATDTRNTSFEISAGKLSLEQNSIATEAARALMLLNEDGSSVAFPETVAQMHEDMLQVANRLSAAKTGDVTREIEEDIVETLTYIVDALVQSQEDLEKMKPPQNGQPGGGQQAGDRPLVDQLAEIKMLRGIQQRIYKRHQRYSELLPDPSDPVGTSEDPDLQAALQRLAARQQQLTEIAQDIVAGKNK